MEQNLIKSITIGGVEYQYDYNSLANLPSNTSGSSSESTTTTSNMYVTPEQFGAVGDGVNDDAPALQEALLSGKRVILNKDIYIFSTITVADKDAYLDGQGYKIYANGKNFNGTEESMDEMYMFINFVCFYQDDDDTCEMSVVTDSEYIDFSDGNSDRDKYQRGYVSYMGENPTPTKEVYDNPIIRHWHAHSVTIMNTIFECSNVPTTFIINIDRRCHVYVSNIRMYTTDHDGGMGIRAYLSYDQHYNDLYIEGFPGLASRRHPATNHSLGSALSCAGTGIFINNCYFKNCRAELALGHNRQAFDCNVVINNVVITRIATEYDDFNYTVDRLLDLHANIHTPILNNIKIQISSNLTTGCYVFLWRCPIIYANNISITTAYQENQYSNGRLEPQTIGIQFGELVERVYFNGLYAEDAMLYIGNNYCPNIKEIQINNGILRRIETQDSPALLRCNNVIVSQYAWGIRNGYFNNCSFPHDITWNVPTIKVIGRATFLNCTISGEWEYWGKSTPIIQAPKNSVTMNGCKIITMISNQRKTVNTDQQNLFNNYEEDIYGFCLDTRNSILDKNNLF